MKKSIITLPIVIFCLLIMPSLVFASWWNPSSWFETKNSVEISISMEISSSTPSAGTEIKTEYSWWNPLSWVKKETIVKQEVVSQENSASTTENIISENDGLESETPADLELETAKAKAIEMEIAKAKAEAEKYKLEAEKIKLETEKLKQENTAQTQTQVEEEKTTKVQAKEEKITETIEVKTNNIEETNLCDSTKNEFNNFEEIYLKASTLFSEANKIYSESNSEGLTGLSYFKNNYSKETARKEIFSQYLTELKGVLLEIPNLEKDNNNLVKMIKQNYEQGISKFLYSYNLKIEALKSIVEDQYNSTIESSMANLDKSYSIYVEGFDYFIKGINDFYLLKDSYEKILIEDGCESFCSNGLSLSKGNCLPAYKTIIKVSPTSGTTQTIFTLIGKDFGDYKKTGDFIKFGYDNAEIISWSNNEIKFKFDVKKGYFSVKLESLNPKQTTSIDNIRITD